MIKIVIFFLFALIFISKISIKFLGVIPKSFSIVIFQYGLHPYINFFLQFFLGLVIFIFWIKNDDRFRKFSINYFLMIAMASQILIVQTFFQIVYKPPEASFSLYTSGLVIALTLIILYGLIIPSLVSGLEFIRVTLAINIPIVFISLILSPIFWSSFQKGGRFTGIYKHIPHMVTASSISYMFLLSFLIFNFKKIPFARKLFSFFLLSIFLIASLLTFTKAMYFSIALFTLLAPFVLTPRRNSYGLFKTMLILSFCTLIIFLGTEISKKIIDYSTGRESIGLRQAQNGVESRTEEIFRGLEIFKKSPIFGQGILYKYINSQSNEVEVESYNSFKDPHNLFVSAGVIGGAPLVIYTIIAYILLFFTSLRTLLSSSFEKRLFSLFILCHIPVLFIYHAHLSIGGIADRVYWLAIGFMCKKSN